MSGIKSENTRDAEKAGSKTEYQEKKIPVERAHTWSDIGAFREGL